MLLVMTVLGITAMQVTRMEERMAGNSRDVNLAFQGAEAGLRDARRATSDHGGPARDRASAAPCVGIGRTSWPPDLRDQTLAWWTTNGPNTELPARRKSPKSSRDPMVVIEEMTTVSDPLTCPSADGERSRNFYKVTANSAGAMRTPNAVLETTYTRADSEANEFS